MVEYYAFNVKTKKKELMKNPVAVVKDTKRGPRYTLKAEGANGITLNRFITKAEYEKFPNKGVFKKKGGRSKSKSRSKSKDSKRGGSKRKH